MLSENIARATPYLKPGTSNLCEHIDLLKGQGSSVLISVQSKVERERPFLSLGAPMNRFDAFMNLGFKSVIHSTI